MLIEQPVVHANRERHAQICIERMKSFDGKMLLSHLFLLNISSSYSTTNGNESVQPFGRQGFREKRRECGEFLTKSSYCVQAKILTR